MFYNNILKASQEFTVEHKYCPTIIYMSPKYYDSLEMEMYGNQKRFLIKCSLVLGLKIIIDYDVKDFNLE